MLISHYLQEEEEEGKRKNTQKMRTFNLDNRHLSVPATLFCARYSVATTKIPFSKRNDSVFSISLQSTVFRLRQLKPHFMLQNLFPLLYDPPLLLAMIAAASPQPPMPSEFITIGFYHILEAYERSNERLVVMSRGLDSVGSQ